MMPWFGSWSLRNPPAIDPYTWKQRFKESYPNQRPKSLFPLENSWLKTAQIKSQETAQDHPRPSTRRVCRWIGSLFHQSDPEHRKKKNLEFSLTPHRWLSYLNVRIHVHILYTSCVYIYIYAYIYIWRIYVCISYNIINKFMGIWTQNDRKKVANWR